MPLSSALDRQRQVDLCEFKSQSILPSEFQNSQGYVKRPCIKNQRQRQRKRETETERETE